jgi:hypothetical protein
MSNNTQTTVTLNEWSPCCFVPCWDSQTPLSSSCVAVFNVILNEHAPDPFALCSYLDFQLIDILLVMIFLYAFFLLFSFIPWHF